MPLIFQKRIYREDLRANPKVFYVFGDNLHHVGLGGQAKEMRGEPNSIGIVTKKLPTMEENAFFEDEDFKDFFMYVAPDLATIERLLINKEIVVWPSAGFVQLSLCAPKCNDFIEQHVSKFKEM